MKNFIKLDREVIIVGGGYFGYLAARQLSDYVKVVIEQNPSPQLLNLGVNILQTDGLYALSQLLNLSKVNYWVIPCLPNHLLVNWLFINLSQFQSRLISVPIFCLYSLPILISGLDYAWYLSLTNNRCSSVCDEKKRYCLKLKGGYSIYLWNLLMKVKIPKFSIAALISYQLRPGIGGLASEEMLMLRERISNYGGGRWLISTACRCHGVIQAVEFINIY